MERKETFSEFSYKRIDLEEVKKKRDQQARMDIPCVIMEADLNMRNPENAYTMGDLDAFFAQSIDWAEVFVDAFLKG